MALSILIILLKITCVLLIALCATLAMRRASAGSRHLVWFLSLAALLVLPAVAAWAPLEVEVLPQGVETVKGVEESSGQAFNGARIEAPVSRPLDSSTSRPPVLPALPVLLALTWAIIAASLLGRLLFGALSVRRIVRRARLLDDPAWQSPLYEIADRLGLDAAPRLLRSSDVKMPFAAGLVTPTIILPTESADWTADRRSAVLVHELGHVRRRDLIGHTLSRVVCALYWFHPLVWTAAHRLRSESEQACDDLALSFGAKPSEYAEHLLDIVTCVRDHRTPAVAIAMAHRKEFEGRMLAILNPELRRRGPSRARGASYACALAGVALLIGAVSPVEKGSAVHGLRSTVASRQSTVEGHRSIDAAFEAGGTQLNSRRSTPDARRSTPDAQRQTPDSISDPRRAELLAQILRNDQSAESRRIAAWGLQHYADGDVAVAALVRALGGDADARVREMAAWALADASGESAAGAALVKALQDGDASVRSTAIWALGNMGDPQFADALTSVLRDAEPANREVAAWAIGNAAPSKAPATLLDLLSDQNRAVRLATAWALYNIGDESAASALDAALRKETDQDVQVGMIRALGAMGDQAVAALERVLTSSDSTVRSVAIAALANGDATGPWPWPRPEPRPYP